MTLLNIAAKFTQVSGPANFDPAPTDAHKTG
jgi:hypothetical protein